MLKSHTLKYFFLLSFMFAVLYFIQSIFFSVTNFPVNKEFAVNKGDNGEEIFNNLEKENFISNVFSAKIISKLFNLNKFYPGEYVFEKESSTYEVIYKLTKRPISYSVLIPEGFTKVQIADRLAKNIKKFDKKDFLNKAKEGYLFPDTYFFYSFASVDEILKEFENKFYKETFENLGRVPSEKEVILASILEREARKKEDMRVVTGILENRLNINMPLQVDATVLYGKNIWKSRTLFSDLQDDSPYNTYRNTGLPPGPISNPGLNSLRAVIDPINSEYIYYLTGADGQMYYAKTFPEHVQNRKYLR